MYSYDMKKGATFTKQHKKNLSLSHKGIQAGSKNGQWKGDNVGYMGIHLWIKRHKTKPNNCENCGVAKTTPRSIQWANKDHKYSRNLADWLALCPPCHKEYDVASGNIKISGEYNPFFGKSHTEESKAKMRQALKGRIPWNKKK